MDGIVTAKRVKFIRERMDFSMVSCHRKAARVIGHAFSAHVVIINDDFLHKLTTMFSSPNMVPPILVNLQTRHSQVELRKITDAIK